MLQAAWVPITHGSNLTVPNCTGHILPGNKTQCANRSRAWFSSAAERVGYDVSV